MADFHETFSLVAELQSALAPRAEDILTAWKDAEEVDAGNRYAQIAAALPGLHFIAAMVFHDQHHDPLLMIEVNVDGRRGPFLAAFEGAYGGMLRELLRCCKRPPGGVAAAFDAATAPGSTAPLAPVLDAMVLTPLTPYRGARGFSRARIEAERALHDAAQAALGDGRAFANKSAAQAHAELRARLMQDGATAALLAAPAPDPAPWRPTLRDRVELAAVIGGLVLLLGAPALILAWLLGPPPVAVATSVAAAVIWRRWTALRAALGLVARGPVKPGAVRLAALRAPLVWSAALIAIAALLHVSVGFPAPRGGAVAAAGQPAFWPAALDYALLVIAGLAGAVLALFAALAVIRRREDSDPVHEPAAPDAATVRAISAMAAREDRIGQNHMGSLLIVKPGAFRALLLRISHLLLSRLARTQFSDGWLGPMRTIHFAHWSLLNNGGRLVFFSNFDGSWDSYLSDFTEKASGGVNLAWWCCIGFPAAAFVLSGGSRNGRQFKAWARHSMAPTQFWFSAYRDLSVGAIHRHARVADGLRRSRLDDPAAWARDL